MIIISQDKDKIVNFDNTFSIEIYPPADDTQNFEILAEKVNGELDILGYYKTEERAKEVLQEIIRRYEHCKCLNANRSIEVQDIFGNNYFYEMPEK